MSRTAYDPNLFLGTAAYYDRYRFEYPQDLFKELRREMSIKSSDRIMDLGCGTGQLTFPLSSMAKEVVGIDPDKEMIDVARAKIHDDQMSNIRFQRGSSWDIPLDGTAYDAAFMGESFHWMDREDVLERLGKMLPMHGRVAILSRRFEVPDEILNTIERTRVEFLGPELRAGTGSYPDPEVQHEEILARSPFGLVSECTIGHSIVVDVDQLVGYQFSTSYGAARHFGAQLDEYEHTLRSRLSVALSSNTISFPAQAIALIGKRRQQKEHLTYTDG